MSTLALVGLILLLLVVVGVVAAVVLLRGRAAAGSTALSSHPAGSPRTVADLLLDRANSAPGEQPAVAEPVTVDEADERPVAAIAVPEPGPVESAGESGAEVEPSVGEGTDVAADPETSEDPATPADEDEPSRGRLAALPDVDAGPVGPPWSRGFVDGKPVESAPLPSRRLGRPLQRTPEPRVDRRAAVDPELVARVTSVQPMQAPHVGADGAMVVRGIVSPAVAEAVARAEAAQRDAARAEAQASERAGTHQDVPLAPAADRCAEGPEDLSVPAAESPVVGSSEPEPHPAPADDESAEALSREHVTAAEVDHVAAAAEAPDAPSVVPSPRDPRPRDDRSPEDRPREAQPSRPMFMAIAGGALGAAALGTVRASAGERSEHDTDGDPGTPPLVRLHAVPASTGTQAMTGGHGADEDRDPAPSAAAGQADDTGPIAITPPTVGQGDAVVPDAAPVEEPAVAEAQSAGSSAAEADEPGPVPGATDLPDSTGLSDAPGPDAPGPDGTTDPDGAEVPDDAEAPAAEVPDHRAAEHAAVDLALLRTLGFADPNPRPGAVPVVDMSGYDDDSDIDEARAAEASPVRFHVVRRDGMPVVDAGVTLLDARGREAAGAASDVEGRGVVLAPHPGAYVLVSSAHGHQPGVAALTVGAERLDVEVLLTRSGSIVGVVRGPGSAPVGAASVTLLQDGELVAATESGATGAYRFDDLAAGEYTLTAMAPQHVPAVGTVRLPEETEVEQDVELARAEPAVTVPAAGSATAEAATSTQAG
jgi:hypothetical protein